MRLKKLSEIMSIHHQEKLRHLRPFDLIALSLIFFGHAIYASLQQYTQLRAEGISAPSDLGISDHSNYWGIAFELTALLIAYLYLRYRRFDFAQLPFALKGFTLFKTLGFILCAGILAALVEYLQYLLFPPLESPTYQEAAEDTAQIMLQELFAYVSFSLSLFALLNGFFEEIFFLGLIFCVEKKHLPYAIAYSLLIRFAFHTYQGLAAAITISSLGIVFALLRLRYRELVPFMLAHSFFDIFGLTFLLNLLYLFYSL